MLWDDDEEVQKILVREGDGSPSFDQCETGEGYSFIFDKVGAWRYHNHIAPSRTGTVVVKE